jgi:3-deoxy-manno-octulosonate cytidylyltransferase (CMP-KDO synthetase)
MHAPRCQVVIPARLASTRLPRKLLLRAGGKTILQHTYEAARQAGVPQGVVVAVDDQLLAEEVESFGGRAVMTSPECPSGTDRIAQVAAAMPDVEVFVNVQGDEPEIDPATIDEVALALVQDAGCDLSTAGTPIRDTQTLNDPACVKIVLAGTTSMQGNPEQGRAVYFSRSPVPHVRDGISDKILRAEPPVFWHHLGIYAYRRDFLSWFASQSPSFLERIERLEQLRAIEAEKRVTVVRVDRAAPGIDTQADFDAFLARVERAAP